MAWSARQRPSQRAGTRYPAMSARCARSPYRPCRSAPTVAIPAARPRDQVMGAVAYHDGPRQTINRPARPATDAPACPALSNPAIKSNPVHNPRSAQMRHGRACIGGGHAFWRSRQRFQAVQQVEQLRIAAPRCASSLKCRRAGSPGRCRASSAATSAGVLRYGAAGMEPVVPHIKPDIIPDVARSESR